LTVAIFDPSVPIAKHGLALDHADRRFAGASLPLAAEISAGAKTDVRFGDAENPAW
jgi:hypothetical protein